MINNLGGILLQIQELQNELQSKRVEGASSGGEVCIVMNGCQEILEVSVAPGLMDSSKIESFGKLLAEALNNAQAESRKAIKEEISRSTGLDLPLVSKLTLSDIDTLLKLLVALLGSEAGKQVEENGSESEVKGEAKIKPELELKAGSEQKLEDEPEAEAGQKPEPGPIFARKKASLVQEWRYFKKGGGLKQGGLKQEKTAPVFSADSKTADEKKPKENIREKPEKVITWRFPSQSKE